MNLFQHICRQIVFSRSTFGPGDREKGVIDHIRKELVEIENAPTPELKLKEWIDVIILAIDGAWRCLSVTNGGNFDTVAAIRICDEIEAKQQKNENRVWPDWRTMPTDKAIEHDRSHD